MTYLEMVKKDIRNAVEDGYYNVVIYNIDNRKDGVKRYSQLLKQMWNDEHITGNSSGGYYYYPQTTIKTIQENIKEVKGAYDFFDCDLEQDLKDDEYAKIDSKTRCYFLINVLYDVLKETKTI